MLFSISKAAGLAAVLAVAGIALACVEGIPVATPADAARGAARFPGLTATELSDGRSLFASRCSACHSAPSPTSHAPDQWHLQVAEMQGRAHLDAHQAQLIERYLVTMSMPARRSGG